ncbi:general substrate transporter [Fomitiporia mediterranea MF3/22]|uniref:general substrate transporter n=1 Tax=Fomitiporia mediterranea (strain MF3/22) TaxID=694068 RepID=UPI00044081EF|nr:general substrate transporter [Fomitiporia mediterranea MF3/22]EJD02102.1 general substrate transporter [Fomitiporia mediterranea MF3/22]
MSSTLQASSFTSFGLFCLFWLLISAFQYGFHISALNQISDVLTCRDTQDASKTIFYRHLLPSCIPMTDAEFSVVTSAFTIGGLFGSLIGGGLTERKGRKGALLIDAFITLAGALALTFAPGMFTLGLGRVLVGLGAGIGVSVGPVFLGELAPPAIKGATGVLFQVAIVFGILTTQGIGLSLASPWTWRYVPFASAALAFVQLAIAAAVPESHAWLSGNGQAREAERVRDKLWVGGGGAAYSRVSHDPEAADSDDEDIADPPAVFTAHSANKTLSLGALLRAPELRTPVLVVVSAMAAQQFSGINAVLYYSNLILGKTLPALGPYVSLAITVVNVAMTFPPVFLIERMGRKSLLNISMLGAFVSLLAVGYGLDTNQKVLASTAIITFVASFACGMGPVPFVVISDIAPYHAVGALSSAALSLNWIANFTVGLIFLPLRNFLSQDDPEHQEGRVFYVFAATLVGFGAMLNVVYREKREADRR